MAVGTPLFIVGRIECHGNLKVIYLVDAGKISGEQGFGALQLKPHRKNNTWFLNGKAIELMSSEVQFIWIDEGFGYKSIPDSDVAADVFNLIKSKGTPSIEQLDTIKNNLKRVPASGIGIE